MLYKKWVCPDSYKSCRLNIKPSSNYCHSYLEPLVALNPVEVEVGQKEGGDYVPHVVVEPAGEPQLPHSSVDQGVASVPLLPSLEMVFVGTPPLVLKMRNRPALLNVIGTDLYSTNGMGRVECYSTNGTFLEMLDRIEYKGIVRAQPRVLRLSLD